MENILALVKALNAFGPGEYVEAGLIIVSLKGATEKDRTRSFGIKQRPVADKEGVQKWQYVAREERN